LLNCLLPMAWQSFVSVRLDSSRALANRRIPISGT
jgi:hypothetical protein